MASEFYDHTTYPSQGAAGSSAALRSELDLIETGFNKILSGSLSANADKVLVVNAAGTLIDGAAASGTGAFVRASSPTLTTPVLGVATATSINKYTFTTPSTSATLTIADGKALVVSNSVTFAGTDGSTLNFGAGGTLGTAAFTAASAYAALAFSTIAVAGQSDIVADGVSDTLTIVAGANITLTTTAGTDTLTITGTSVGDHAVTVTTGNGHGSTNTKIRRFTTTQSSVGSAITYADSATLGASFTINSDGLYEIYYGDASSSGSNIVGISLNSAQLTTDIQAITAANRVGLSASVTANDTAPVTRTLRLVATDVIRPHTNSAPNAGTAYQTIFSVRKVGA
jgi:hypothetical protein